MQIDEQTYRTWIELFDTLDADDLAEAARFARGLQGRPAFDVVMAVHDPEEAHLREAISSVRAQIYPHWTLCIHDDGSEKPHVEPVLVEACNEDSRIRMSRDVNRGLAHAANCALRLGSSEFVTFLDHDDLLPAHALLLMAYCLEQQPDTNVVHWDADMLDTHGRRMNPHFAPQYDHELLLGYNAVWGAFRRRVVEDVGGLRADLTGSEDYDLSLRVAERVPPRTIRHLPFVLYHWRMVPTSSSHARLSKAIASAQRAVREHCERIGVPSHVTGAPQVLAFNRVRALPHHAISTMLVIESAHDGHAHELSARLAAATNHQEVSTYTRSRDARTSLGAFRNEAARTSDTELLAFIDGRLHPRNDDWLLEMSSHFAYSECAVVGCPTVGHDGRIEQAGLLLGVREQDRSFPVARALHGASGDDTGYYGRNVLAHGASAVGGGVFLVRRRTVLDLGGFDETLGDANAVDIDFCLRVRARGHTLIENPHAVFDAVAPMPWLEDTESTKALRERWPRELEEDRCYSPNLTRHAADFSLAFPPRARFPWRSRERLGVRILVRTNVDWASMDSTNFAAQSDSTRPLIFIAHAAKHDFPACFRDAFGFDLFEYRRELRRIAENSLRAVPGACLSIGFEDFDDWFYDEQDEFVFPIDDDDLFSPKLTRALRNVREDTLVVLWDSVQAGFIDNEPATGCRRSPWPALCANNWGVRKSFLKKTFDRDSCRRFLSDQQFAQTSMAAHLGVSLEDRPPDMMQAFAPLMKPGVVQLSDCYSVNVIHVGSISFFWVVVEQGAPRDIYRRFDPSLLVAPDAYVEWSAPYLQEMSDVVRRLKSTSPS